MTLLILSGPLYPRPGNNANLISKLIPEILSAGHEVRLFSAAFGEPLKALLQQSLLGIDVLGGHRKDYPVSSSLKSREYCAYGIPVITSSPIDYFQMIPHISFSHRMMIVQWIWRRLCGFITPSTTEKTATQSRRRAALMRKLDVI